MCSNKMDRLRCCALLAFSLFSLCGARPPIIGSVTYDPTTQSFTVHSSIADTAVATASFADQRQENGWMFLNVSTDESQTDVIQAYAAGLLEGVLTASVISQHWNNTMAGYCDEGSLSTYCKSLSTFLDTNFNGFVRENIERRATQDPYWHQVELFLYQLSGLEDGYRNTPGRPSLSVRTLGLLLLQVSGDLEDLEVALNKPDALKQRVVGDGSCSALVKLLPGNKDLFVAQDTWTAYQNMLRILKKYDFGFHLLEAKNSPIVPGRAMTFSSYPGVLYSGDDFYVLSSGLVSMETTIGNSNMALYQLIAPDNSVLEGVRNQVANRLAEDGWMWADLFSRYNSGTYNNQWMVVDYNQFTPGQPVQKGTLTVLEQIPGMVVWDDLSEFLSSQTYWPSYNSPFFKEIFNASGGNANVAKYGDWFTYDKTPRAVIFRRDNSKVNDIDSMIKLMRYNNYQEDPVSRCNCTPPFSAENAISARSDLNPKNGTYPFGALGHRSHGGVDMKVTSYEMYGTLDFIAVCGPTHDDLPPFSWLTADFAADTPHEGHPDTFDFQPIKTNWAGKNI